MPEQYKKPPITNRKYPEGDWKKMFSRAAGFYLKLKEQVCKRNIKGKLNKGSHKKVQ